MTCGQLLRLTGHWQMLGIKMSQLMAMKKSFIHYSEYENGKQLRRIKKIENLGEKINWNIAKIKLDRDIRNHKTKLYIITKKSLSLH